MTTAILSKGYRFDSEQLHVEEVDSYLASRGISFEKCMQDFRNGD